MRACMAAGGWCVSRMSMRRALYPARRMQFCVPWRVSGLCGTAKCGDKVTVARPIVMRSPVCRRQVMFTLAAVRVVRSPLLPAGSPSMAVCSIRAHAVLVWPPGGRRVHGACAFPIGNGGSAIEYRAKFGKIWRGIRAISSCYARMGCSLISWPWSSMTPPRASMPSCAAQI